MQSGWVLWFFFVRCAVDSGTKIGSPYERLFALVASLTSAIMSGAKRIAWVNERLQIIVKELYTGSPFNEVTWIKDPYRQFQYLISCLSVDRDDPQSMVGRVVVALQHIVDTPDTIEVPGVHNDAVNQWVIWWCHAFPRRGREIMALLAPFYHPQLSFRLQPASDLEAIARDVVCWRSVKGVKVVTDVLRISDHSCSAFDISSCMGPSTTVVAEQVGKNRLMQGLVLDWCARLKTSLGEDGIGEGFLAPRKLDYGLRQTLIWSMAYVVAGQTNWDFHPLLRLWASGNLPIGFDNDNNLVLLCAKEGVAQP